MHMQSLFPELMRQTTPSTAKKKKQKPYEPTPVDIAILQLVKEFHFLTIPQIIDAIPKVV